MDTRAKLNLIKNFTESDDGPSADSETLEVYKNNVRRFIRPKSVTTKLNASTLINSDFSFFDIVNKEQIENPNTISEDGKSLSKLEKRLDVNFDSNDSIFDLDDDLDALSNKISRKQKRIKIKTKSMKTRYK